MYVMQYCSEKSIDPSLDNSIVSFASVTLTTVDVGAWPDIQIESDIFTFWSKKQSHSSHLSVTGGHEQITENKFYEEHIDAVWNHYGRELLSTAPKNTEAVNYPGLSWLCSDSCKPGIASCHLIHTHPSLADLPPLCDFHPYAPRVFSANSLKCLLTNANVYGPYITCVICRPYSLSYVTQLRLQRSDERSQSSEGTELRHTAVEKRKLWRDILKY